MTCTAAAPPAGRRAGARARAVVGPAGVPGAGAGPGRRLRLGRSRSWPPSPAVARSGRPRRGCRRSTWRSRCGSTRSRSPSRCWSPGSARSCWSTARGTSSPGTTASAGSRGNLVAFAGSMLGLVLADDLLLLYVFWELTTVFSFLLIGGGGHPARGPARGEPGADPHHRRRAGDAGRHPARRPGQRQLPAVGGASRTPAAGRRWSRAPCCSSSARSPSRRWCRSTSGCPPRWRRPPRSARTCTPRRW